ncbi:Oxidoreductase [Heterostelium album PN500]|uniref:Oxidoreductase n=1 Tax=Heterostelium pallidum (strain ATCC 26659 / Pp 5 / PN500) TaxID=670386 RepID=D3BRE3_HETP5|nr:Oxidoreductase [Heterostelium album PN500]EFA75975.1 Oxidoreductase [Heterostelium album PN500]|eukprot:XP_020428109.1 Oxidoreductase [Heterostelium album PN500]
MSSSSLLEIKSNDKVWYITGASKGLGLIFVKKLLAYGFKVVGTSRNKQQLIDAVGPLATPDNFLAVKVELDNEESVKQSLTDSLLKFGRIDVVVNNAGYGISGALEENTDAEVRKNFDINVFGVYNVLRNVTPILRAQGHGHVFNVSSIVSFVGFQGHSTYSATKFAIDGLTEAYAQEVRPFGIRATTINPGFFKSEFASNELFQQTNKIDSYKALHDVMEQSVKQVDITSRGDPAKLLDFIIRVYQTPEYESTHIFVGGGVYPLVNSKIDKYKQDLAQWEPFATQTDFDDYKSTTNY